jgi:acetyltransferase-like isoleucine patch superfamily enzyme
VGNHVLISSNVSIIGNDHPFTDRSVTVYDAPRLDDSSVEIGSDVLIGFGTIIVGSVSIGDGCVVGAGSVVVRDLPRYTVCAGVPAKPLRPRYEDGGREVP